MDAVTVIQLVDVAGVCLIFLLGVIVGCKW